MLMTIKKFIVIHFELLFIITVLGATALINYAIPYKIAFLNFYFIPILLAATYLGLESTVYGAILCTFLVFIAAYLYPEPFRPGNTNFDIFFNIFTWACFLVLTGGIVGTIQDKHRKNLSQISALNKNLLTKEEELELSNKELEEYSKNLEEKVKLRTFSLEESKMAIEHLKQRVEEALYSTMDPAVAKLIIEDRIRNEKRNISILFSDLKGFTSYSDDRQPEVVIDDLNRYLQEMESILLKYRGHIDKYMGDGIMAEFGAPINYDTHAMLAVAAALKMHEKMKQAQFPWEMRIGIASGNAIVGLIGRKRRTYTAIGDVVNLASRLEQLCTPGKIVVNEEAYQVIKNFVIAKRILHIGDHVCFNQKERELIEKLHQKLEESPKDLKTNKELARRYHRMGTYDLAVQYYKKALNLSPDDDAIKVAYAECTIEMERQGNIQIRGKKRTLHIYEIHGLKNPLLDRKKIPQSLYDRYIDEVNRLVAYPENITLPVEALDCAIGHGRAVGFLAYAIADAMELNQLEKEDILLAGYLCDIGKEIIPPHLLNRRGGLTDEDFAEISKHCDEGVRILKKNGYQTEYVFDIIAAHHENINGTGYPRGLKGNEIPIGAKIISVADSYDALTSWRPYRDRWDYRAAFGEIQKGKNSGKFDPNVVDELGKMLGLAV